MVVQLNEGGGGGNGKFKKMELRERPLNGLGASMLWVIACDSVRNTINVRSVCPAYRLFVKKVSSWHFDDAAVRNLQFNYP